VVTCQPQLQDLPSQAKEIFSQGLQQLGESTIITAKMDLRATIHTNILPLESKLQGYDMALTDDPHPRKKAKLEEQMEKFKQKLTN
jgi:hypothetical protein